MNFKRMLLVFAALMAMVGCDITVNGASTNATPSPTPTANSVGN